MLKKIFLFLILLISIFFINQWYAETEAEHTARCADTWDCIDKTSFSITVNDISPWMDIQTGNSEENVNYALGTIIQTLMIALWGLSILIMTVGAWYIVMHNWQDELLSKWKSIFMSWVIALIAALSSYYMISILTYILYKWN